MKAITLHQPWATLIADRRKRIETRHWAAPRSLVGHHIAIHAAKKVDRHYAEEFGYEVRDLPVGCVVAVALLSQVWRVRDMDWQTGSAYCEPAYGDGDDKWIIADKYGDFDNGRYLWQLQDIDPLTPPIPAVGHQGFWEWVRD